MKLNSIVIDKDYLQSCKAEEIKQIIEQGYRLLVTAELGYEIFTTDHQPFSKKCFKDLLVFREHIDIVEHLGTLINTEIEKHTPCFPISSYFLPPTHQLNPNFNFIFDNEMSNHLKEFEINFEKSPAIQFEKVALEIKNNFPGLKKSDINNPEEIGKIYEQLRGNNKFPHSVMINEQWVIFRRLQVDCLATIEYLQSLKDEQFNICEERKRHNQVDFRICVFALLTKGLASKDKLIRRHFKFLCPDGILFPKEQ